MSSAYADNFLVRSCNDDSTVSFHFENNSFEISFFLLLVQSRPLVSDPELSLDTVQGGPRYDWVK